MSARIIQVRPSRNLRWQKQGGWEVFEAEGVSPVYCGEGGRESALSYARQHAGYGRAESQVPDERWNISVPIATAAFTPEACFGRASLLLAVPTSAHST